MKRALITGITGQDGSYLAELLIEKGYEVHGLIRRSSITNTTRIDNLLRETPKDKLTLHYGDLSDSSNINYLISSIKPHEIYNLGAQSHVGVSFQSPEYTADVDALGTLRILESVRNNNLTDHTRIYQASTSELYGLVQEIPQTEQTPFYPRSPYAVAKLYAYWITVNYRESYGMFACNGILFNHESPRRGETFVTRKVTLGLSKIACGLEECLYMGNIDSLRDWGHAKDYVHMQWLMLQNDVPKDYVIATSRQYSVREFIKWAGEALGFTIEFHGRGTDEVGFVASKTKASDADVSVGDIVIRIDPQFYRPAEVDTLLGNPDLAQTELGWVPMITAKQMCIEMVQEDYKKMKIEKYTRNA